MDLFKKRIEKISNLFNPVLSLETFLSLRTSLYMSGIEDEARINLMEKFEKVTEGIIELQKELKSVVVPFSEN